MFGASRQTRAKLTYSWVEKLLAWEISQSGKKPQMQIISGELVKLDAPSLGPPGTTEFCSREKEKRIPVPVPPLFLNFKKGHAMGKQMAGTNEFAFFLCGCMGTEGGLESGRKNFEKCLPAGIGTKIYFSSITLAWPPLQCLAVKKNFFFVQILGGEKLLKFGEKWAVKKF